MNLAITPKHKFFELSKDIRMLSDPLKTYLGINYFAFKRTYVDGSKIYLFNNPTYYEHWFKNNYFLIGNKESAPSTYRDSYDLWEHLPDPHNLYREGAECFNITHGLTITKNHDVYCDFFFFATNRENLQVKKIYFNKKEVFENYCHYFLETAAKSIEEAKKHKIVLPFAPTIETISKEIDFDKFLKEIHTPKKD